MPFTGLSSTRRTGGSRRSRWLGGSFVGAQGTPTPVSASGRQAYATRDASHSPLLLGTTQRSHHTLLLHALISLKLESRRSLNWVFAKGEYSAGKWCIPAAISRMSWSWSHPRELFMAARGVPVGAPGTSTLPLKIFTLRFVAKCIIICFLVAPSSAGWARRRSLSGQGGCMAVVGRCISLVANARPSWLSLPSASAHL